jgi:hypothetical protein
MGGFDQFPWDEDLWDHLPPTAPRFDIDTHPLVPREVRISGTSMDLRLPLVAREARIVRI